MFSNLLLVNNTPELKSAFAVFGSYWLEILIILLSFSNFFVSGTMQIAATLAVLISKIARIDYPKEWYILLLLMSHTRVTK